MKSMSYKALFAIAAALNLKIKQIDVKTVFLYEDIIEKIFVKQLTDLNNETDWVCCLNKTLYDLKQSLQIWYKTLIRFLQKLGFEPLAADLSVFVRNNIFITVYVNDLLIVRQFKLKIQEIKNKLSIKFQITDLELCSYYLDMRVTQNRSNHTIYLSQDDYVEKILWDFNMWECKKTDTFMNSNKMKKTLKEHQVSKTLKTVYQSAVESLMYVMLETCSDIAFAVSVISRYRFNLTEAHWKAVKHIFYYLKSTVNTCLVFCEGLTALTEYILS